MNLFPNIPKHPTCHRNVICHRSPAPDVQVPDFRSSSICSSSDDRSTPVKWNSWLDELFMNILELFMNYSWNVHMTGSWTIVHEQFTIQVHEWLKNISWIWKGSWTIHKVFMNLVQELLKNIPRTSYTIHKH